MEEAGVERIVRFMRARPDGFASLEEAAQHIADYRGRPMEGPIEGLKKNLRLNAQGRWVWHWDPLLMSEANHNHRRDADGYERALRGLQAPTLLLRGQRSDVISEEDARALVQTLPRPVRCNSCSPTSASSCWIWRLMDDCATSNTASAVVRLPRRATWKK